MCCKMKMRIQEWRPLTVLRLFSTASNTNSMLIRVEIRNELCKIDEELDLGHTLQVRSAVRTLLLLLHDA